MHSFSLRIRTVSPPPHSLRMCTVSSPFSLDMHSFTPHSLKNVKLFHFVNQEERQVEVSLQSFKCIVNIRNYVLATFAHLCLFCSCSSFALLWLASLWSHDSLTMVCGVPARLVPPAPDVPPTHDQQLVYTQLGLANYYFFNIFWHCLIFRLF
jgi:hypothetical protein